MSDQWFPNTRVLTSIRCETGWQNKSKFVQTILKWLATVFWWKWWPSVTWWYILISCLLYADDLVLLSTCERGLQNCYINSHSIVIWTVCQSNIITFCKNDKLPSTKFTYKNNEIKYVISNKYPGILFSAPGTFTHCQNDLYRRASRANFKLSKSFRCKSYDALVWPHC
jgi:hypothetical protein